MKKIFLLGLHLLSCIKEEPELNAEHLAIPHKAQTSETKKDSIHLQLGTPSPLASDDDYLIIKDQYALSYNHSRNVNNWVEWKTEAKDYGKVKRYSGQFIPELSLPESWIRPR